VKTYLLFIGFFCLLTVGLVTVWHQVDTLRVGYDVSRLTRMVEDLHRDCNRHVVSITGQKSPLSIDEKARRDGLSLVRPHRATGGTGADLQARGASSDSLRAVSFAKREKGPSGIGRGSLESHRESGLGSATDASRSLGWVSSRGLSGKP
jgi:hypothetical protein